MSEHMGTRVELWVLAADESGLWLVSGEDPWLSGRIPADGDVQGEVDLLAYDHAPDMRLVLSHSTSWRQEEGGVILTWVAIAEVPEYGLDIGWRAVPLTLTLADLVGKPARHDPAKRARIRRIDVLMHAVRHLRFLYDTDTSAQDAMPEHWARHLSEFEPALAGLYQAS